MFGSKKNIVEEYTARRASDALGLFKEDAKKKAKEGYVPESWNWEEGRWGTGHFVFAFLLCFVLVGIPVIVYMLIVNPHGTLTVTYVHKGVKEAGVQSLDDKTSLEGAGKVCASDRRRFDPG